MKITNDAPLKGALVISGLDKAGTKPKETEKLQKKDENNSWKLVSETQGESGKNPKGLSNIAAANNKPEKTDHSGNSAKQELDQFADKNPRSWQSADGKKVGTLAPKPY